MKYGIAGALATALIALASCAGLRGHVRYPASHTAWTVEEQQGPPPAWLHELPMRSDTVFALGESEPFPSKQQALEDAWAGALVRLGMAQFPELTRVGTRSTESLRSNQYQRTVKLALEHVPWTGLQEATDLGSPYLDRDPYSGRFRAFRLLRWSKRDIQTARREMEKSRLLAPAPGRLPLAGASRAMRALSSQASSRDRELSQVFRELKCGVTLKNVIEVLGKPDSFNPNNPHILEKDYRWGSFTLWRVGRDPRIAAVTRDGQSDPFKVICPAKWNP